MVAVHRRQKTLATPLIIRRYAKGRPSRSLGSISVTYLHVARSQSSDVMNAHRYERFMKAACLCHVLCSLARSKHKAWGFHAEGPEFAAGSHFPALFVWTQGLGMWAVPGPIWGLAVSVSFRSLCSKSCASVLCAVPIVIACPTRCSETLSLSLYLLSSLRLRDEVLQKSK